MFNLVPYQWRIDIVNFWMCPPVQFLHFHAVFGKSWKNNRLALMKGWRPSGKSCIHLCTGKFSRFAGIVYSFGIELRDGPLSPCTLELPEDQIIPTAEENFAALRVIFNRVYQAVVPAREI